MDFGFFALYVAAYGSGFANTNHTESVNHHPEMLLEDVNSWFEMLLKMAKRDFPTSFPGSFLATSWLQNLNTLLEDGKTRTRG